VTRRFCDRCDAEIEDAGVPHVDLIAASDEDGCGTITADWDLCPACANAFDVFMRQRPTSPPAPPLGNGDEA